VTLLAVASTRSHFAPRAVARGSSFGSFVADAAMPFAKVDEPKAAKVSFSLCYRQGLLNRRITNFGTV
jgi:hypothetical protein